ncbi:hypothetical protein [Paenibacillus pinihumi]|uniref:hypothetical protein n=1 Tax=Paenibacillus pinihumi TaxID=669462 RepID=UPI0003FD538A|nr:hypothetical protein [Paenibacillus pinihumi]
MRKELEINFPQIQSYPIFANATSVIKGDSAKLWVSTSFLQLKARNIIIDGAIDKNLEYYWFDFMMNQTYQTCPFLNYCPVYKDILDSWPNKKIDYIVSFINKGYFISLVIDYYYLQGTSIYLKKHDTHEILIYGYDLNKKTFLIAAFLQYGKLNFGEMTFDDFEDATRDEDFLLNYWSGDKIELFSPRTDLIYEPDLIAIRNTLIEYLEAKNVPNTTFRPHTVNDNNSWVFGLNAYQVLEDTLVYVTKHLHSHFFWKPFFVIQEHKENIVQLIHYLTQKEVLTGSFELEIAMKNSKNAKVILNLYLKYLENKDLLIINKIVERLHDMIQTEKNILLDIINKINIHTQNTKINI